ncbi:unnamed protein product [Peniophora sp. CBMAI 1063]|nr:unnamed protein product [Peniophora sp. CBMAI 1063]
MARSSTKLSSTATNILTALATTPPANTPYVTGMLALPESLFRIHYIDPDHGARSVDLLTAPQSDIDDLIAASEPSALRRMGKRVVDEAFRKSTRLCASSFATPFIPERTELMDIIRNFLLDDKDSTREFRAEPYELEIYEQGSFFKSHRRAQRDDDGVFGTLISTFPVGHTGGESVLHPYEGDEHVFDTGSKLSTRPPRIAYAAFWGDIHHEVLPVTSGYRVALRYDLSWSVKPEPSSLVPSSSTEQIMEWTTRLQSLLDDDTVLPESGLLCFGIRHSYPVPGPDELNIDTYKPYNLGLDPEIRISYKVDIYKERSRKAQNTVANATLGLANHLVSLDRMGGYKASWEVDREFNAVIEEQNTIAEEALHPSQVIWVTPVTEATCINQPWSTREHEVTYVCARLCIVARVQHYSERRKRLLKRKRVESGAGDGETVGRDGEQDAVKKRRA